MKKIRTIFKKFFAAALIAGVGMTAWAESKTLSLNAGRTDIFPDGYTQGSSDRSSTATADVPFTGDYILTGSCTDDWPLRIHNNTNEKTTFHITLDGATIIGAEWCSAFVVTGNADIDLYLTVKGNSKISGDNHGPVELQSAITLYINVTETKGSNLTLESRKGIHKNYEAVATGGKIILNALPLGEPKESNEFTAVQKFVGKDKRAFSLEETSLVYNKLYKQWIDETRNRYKDVLKTSELKINGYTMPLAYFYDNSVCAEDGRALFISLHGGGGAPKEANDQQWENQKILYKVHKGDVYLCPRAIMDTWDLHFNKETEPFYRAIIQMAVAYLQVNPNKVYLLGYSAGGDGVWRLAPRHADYWAAASMMAGHPGDVSLLNLRNTPFMIWCGANDSSYNRNVECENRIKEMTNLHKADPDGYVFSGNIIKGKGHWMDGVDSSAIEWMYKYTRNPYPKYVVWNQEEVLTPIFYWLKVPENEMERNKRVIVRYDGQTIDIDRCDYKHLSILLNDAMMNLDEPVTVRYCGKEIFKGKVLRTEGHLKQSFAERIEPSCVSYAEIELSKN